jgi:flagellin-like protein
MRKGVSELVSAVVLIAIVLAAMTLFTYFFSVSHSARITSIRDIFEGRRERENELLSILYSSYSNNVIKIYVYNYGDNSIKISKVYIGQTEASFKIYDAYNNALVGELYPRRPYIISISMTITGPTKVVLITDSGNIYSVTVSP